MQLKFSILVDSLRIKYLKVEKFIMSRITGKAEYAFTF